MTPKPQPRAWRPDVAGVSEVLHAYFPDHAYPMHTHDTWTVLVVDAGMVRYDLDRHEHGTGDSLVSILPPGVPHDGRAATVGGFRKRVVYLEPDAIGLDLIGRAVDTPDLRDDDLYAAIDGLHRSLAHRGDELDSEARLALIRERIEPRLRGADGPSQRAHPPVAARLRELIDARVVDGVTLEEASRLLEASPAHLTRSFSAAYGISPHRYLTGRRLDRARRLLLGGEPASSVAAAVGFYDQSHFHRHFRALLGVSPGAFLATR